jgi:hypothetical protein
LTVKTQSSVLRRPNPAALPLLSLETVTPSTARTEFPLSSIATALGKGDQTNKRLQSVLIPKASGSKICKLSDGKHSIVFDFKYDGPDLAKGCTGMLNCANRVHHLANMDVVCIARE